MLQRTALSRPCGTNRPSGIEWGTYSSRLIRLQPCPAAGNDITAEKQYISLDSHQFRSVVVAAAVCCAFVSNVGAARAESLHWIPRRHHRHIGERFTDTWADTIVEVTFVD